MHEIQHAIQDIEGLAAGSNSKKFKREFDDTKDQRTKIKEDLERRISEIEEISGYNEFCRDTDWSNIDFFEGAEMGRRFWANSPYGNEYKSLQAQWRRVTQDSPEHKYLRTPGEREARNIETRQNFSDQQRRNTLLSETLSETEDDNGRFRDENGQFYDEIENETYYQTAQNSQSLDNNPLIETFSQLDTFSNPDTENAYRLSYSPNKRHESGIMRSIRKLLRGFKGDFPLLAGVKQFVYAREILRRMNRNLSAKANITAASLHKHLHGLNAEQFNIFARLMLLNDIYAFSKANKNDNIGLPLGYTQATLRANRDKFVRLAKNDKKVMDAVLAVYNDNKKIRQKLIDVVSKFGFKTLAERLQADDLFLVQYANLLADDDINPNYIKAIGSMRISMLQDLERLYALYKLNERYGKKATLIQEYGKDWRLHIPKGYKLFFPLSGRFLSNAHSLTDEITGEALDDLYQELGLSENARRVMHSKLDKPYETRTLVLPAEIVQTLEQMSNPVQRSAFAELMIRLTSIWKKSALYLLPRAFKYNARNVTGDLDAVLAGDPTAVRWLPQYIYELFTAYYGKPEKISSELKQFQARGGALTLQSAQELGDYKEFKAFNDLIDEMRDKDASAWKNLPRQALALIDKFAWTGIQKASDFREQWLRYAVYLDYLDQMRKNNGIPNNWGASVREEVLALDDIRDRAFKMANELLGAYDQVSETGKQLREILFPFYSWIEVNGKRYWQLIKNGFTQEQFGDFAARFLKGHLANLPYYSYKIGKTLLFINLFGWLVELFNHLFFPDDEEKLPPEIQGTLHITLGHDENGNVRYFSQIGALSDVLDWFDLDMPRYDIQRILNGQMTVSEWLNRMISAPFNKTLNAVTPFIKTTMEMVSGRSLFPEPLNPRPINNRLQALAQSFGLNWPYKWATGENINHWEELKRLFIYKQNAQQAAYFYIRDRVRQYQERVLGQKPFSGSGGGNARTPILSALKRAIRNKDKEAIMSNLDRFYSMKGNDKGLKSSLNSLDPLSGIAKNRRNEFKAWLPERDRAFFNRAEEYYSEFMSFYSTAKAEYDRKKGKTRTQRRY